MACVFRSHQGSATRGRTHDSRSVCTPCCARQSTHPWQPALCWTGNRTTSYALHWQPCGCCSSRSTLTSVPFPVEKGTPVCFTERHSCTTMACTIWIRGRGCRACHPPPFDLVAKLDFFQHLVMTVDLLTLPYLDSDRLSEDCSTVLAFLTLLY